MTSYPCAQMLCRKKLADQPRLQQCLDQSYIVVNTRAVRAERTKSVFQLTGANVTNQSRALLVYSTGEDGEPSIVVSRYQQILQLIPQRLYSIFAVDRYDVNVAIGLLRTS